MAEAFSDWATRVLGERFLGTEVIPPLSPRSGIQGKPVRLCHSSKNFKLNRPTEQRTEQSTLRSEGSVGKEHRGRRIVQRDLNRFAFVGKQKTAQRHASTKYCEHP